MKPVPPKDLWQQLDAVRAELQMVPPPERAFSPKIYRERCGVSEKTAQTQIRKLLAVGKIRAWGTYQNRQYYELAP